MEFSAQQIAQFLQGRVEGDENIKVNNVCRIEEGVNGALAFLANPKYSKYIYDTEASVVIINEDFQLEHPTKATLIRVKDAYSAFATLLELYNSMNPARQGISSLAFVNKDAKVAENVYVGEFAVIEKGAQVGEGTQIYPQVFVGENVKIGKNVVINPGVRIYHDCVVGDNCIIHSGAVLGADGFGFAPLEDGTFKKIPQTGNVVLEDNVEIGANTCVDRSTMGSTIIKKGAKLDNLCQVAHNVVIDHDTVIAGQTGIAGSTSLGANCFIGGQCGIIGHLKVGDRVKMGAKTGVNNNVPDDAELMGHPAIKARDYMKSFVYFKKLPELEKRLAELERKLKD